MDKTIILTNKSTIQKITNKKSQREIIETWDLPFEKKQILTYINHRIQREILNELYMNYENYNEYFETIFLNINIEQKNIKLNKIKIIKILINELNNKRNSYKGQDKSKQMLNNDLLISLYDLIELLVESKLNCSYCKIPIYLLYNEYRYKYQWTLDRINNDIGHHKQNCVISCLDCNLQKKRINDEKFRFTKQMKIIKTE